MIELFCDGGCIGRNPSKVGGTWAWVAVEDGEEAFRDSGILTPRISGVEAVTNNVTELYAAAQSLTSHVARKASEATGRFPGVLYTDSQVTMWRLTTSDRFAGVPNWLRVRILELRRLLRPKVVVLGGHPTRKELASGVRLRNGFTVSKWNQLCDELCQEQAQRYLKGEQ